MLRDMAYPLFKMGIKHLVGQAVYYPVQINLKKQDITNVGEKRIIFIDKLI